MSHPLPIKITDCGVHVKGSNNKRKAFPSVDLGHLPHVSGRRGQISARCGSSLWIFSNTMNRGFERWIGRDGYVVTVAHDHARKRSTIDGS